MRHIAVTLVLSVAVAAAAVGVPWHVDAADRQIGNPGG